MGTISSGIGLISGINIQSVVQQLMAIEAQPLTQLQQRIAKTQQQETAFGSLSAGLLAAKGSTKALADPATFTVRSATSSQPTVLTASATSKTPLGTYSFLVKSLVTTDQIVSAGLATSDSTPVGTGTLIFEVGAGRVDPQTSLTDLNGSQGIRRGVIRITDRSGVSKDIDLRSAVNIDDVLDSINSQSGLNVRASLGGDGILITDTSGLQSGSLTVRDLNGGSAAADMGVAGTSSTGQITGKDLVQLSNNTLLSRLNDGLGIRTAGPAANDLRFNLQDGRQIDVSLAGSLRLSTKLAELNDGRGVRLGTIRITNRNGQSATLDLSAAQTMQDVAAAVNGSGLLVNVALSGGKVLVSDGSGGTSTNLKIEDVSGSAAADLGIAADVAQNSVVGSTVYQVNTVGAVLRAIQYAPGNDGALAAAISSDGKGITLTDTTTGTFTSSVEALNGSQAARDLGLLGDFANNTMTSRHLVAGLDTVLLSSLNGGSGVTAGQVQFTRHDGSTTQIDFSGAQSLRDIIERINATTADTHLSAAVDLGGTSIKITDATAGSGTLAASDITGTTAADLHLAASSTGQLASGDLQLQYLNENTLLTNLNQGRGVAYGNFTVTDSSGKGASLTLSQAAHKTVGDVLKAINGLGLGVQARINASGDGIELNDTAGGSGTLTVADNAGGTAAADLGISGQADSTTHAITGSFSKKISVNGSDTLDQVVTKINAAQAGITAAVINDGTGVAPYRLTITSNTSGTKGRIAFNMGTTHLAMDTLTQAQDAVVVVGSGTGNNPVVVTSSSNTVTGIVDGLKLNLLTTSGSPVQVTVANNADGAVANINAFIKTFNNTMDQFDQLTQFNSDTNQGGILLGDSTAQQVHDQLFASMSAVISNPHFSLRNLNQVGISIGQGARLKLDENAFRAAFTNDPQAVQQLFTATSTDQNGKVTKIGLGALLDQKLSDLTDSSKGTITQQNNVLKSRVDLFNQRVTEMQALLDAKQARLTAQFQAMETALAGLQSQQSALTALSNLATTSTTTSSGLST